MERIENTVVDPDLRLLQDDKDVCQIGNVCQNTMILKKISMVEWFLEKLPPPPKQPGPATEIGLEVGTWVMVDAKGECCNRVLVRGGRGHQV